jgi:hypothetical protein
LPIVVKSIHEGDVIPDIHETLFLSLKKTKKSMVVNSAQSTTRDMINNGVRKRGDKKTDDERIAPGEMLNDQEQNELIQKFREHDNFLNNVYKVCFLTLILILQLILCFLSFVATAYYLRLVYSSPDVRKDSLFLCAVICFVAPGFVFTATEENIVKPQFQVASLLFGFFSLFPIFVVGFQLLFVMPGNFFSVLQRTKRTHTYSTLLKVH